MRGIVLKPFLFSSSSLKFVVLNSFLFLFLAQPVATASQEIAVRPKTKLEKKSKTNDQLVNAPSKNSQKVFEEILKSYVIVADLKTKEETRKISDYVFWRYKLLLPKEDFDLHWFADDAEKQIPVTPGTGREYEHANLGRTQFLAGDYLTAINTWLALKKVWGKDFPYAKRIDYFIARGYLALAAEELKKHPGQKFYEVLEEIKPHLLRAGTFMETTWIVNERVKDNQIDSQRALGLYNLAVMAYAFEKHSRAFAMSEFALEEIVKTEDVSLRPELRRLRAEIFIYTNDFMNAFKELDLGIRQDPNPRDASLMLARIADIYFNFNNYELAEEMYAHAARIDFENERMNLARQVVRGEALFWLGRFDDCQKVMQIALDMEPFYIGQESLTDEYRRIATLRIADSYLAKNQFEEAKLEYFKATQTFRKNWAEKVAKVRSLCLELPQFDGRNIQHGQDGLEELKKDPEMTLEATELAWTCQIASVLDHRKDQDMIRRALEFARAHPEAKIVSRFADAFIEVKAGHLQDLLGEGKLIQAVEFYEKKKNDYYKKLDAVTQKKLFFAYIKIHRSDKALDLSSEGFFATDLTDEEEMLLGVFLAEAEEKIQKADTLSAKTRTRLEQRLQNRRWSASDSVDGRILIGRALNASDRGVHSQWTLNLVRSWVRKDLSNVCEMYLPMASNFMRSQKKDISAKSRNEVSQEYLSILDSQLSNILEKDEACALSLLEVEFNIMESKVEELARRYVSRAEWNMTKDLLGLFMRVASKSSAAGLKKEAKKLWEIVFEKSDEGSSEATAAKAALSEDQTRFDSIWK